MIYIHPTYKYHNDEKIWPGLVLKNDHNVNGFSRPKQGSVLLRRNPTCDQVGKDTKTFPFNPSYEV